MTIIAARSWNRFVVQRLSVAPQLLGAKHEFKFSGKRVELRLPRLERKSDGKLRDDKVSCRSWQIVDGEEIPIAYRIFSVDLLIDVEGDLDIPDQALHMAPTRSELFSKEQQSHLNSLAREYEALAKTAIHHWLRILRWKTHIAYLGEAEIAREESGWATELISAQSNHGFWSPGHSFTVQMEKTISEVQWHETQSTLNAEITAPVWFDFIFEAMQRLNNKDTVAAVLSAAVGLELIIRTSLSLHLSNESAKQPIVTTILDQANLRTIMNHRKRMTLWDAAWEKQFDNSAFEQLMNCRDAIMHRGDVSVLMKPDWQKVFRRLLDFAYFVDERIRSI